MAINVDARPAPLSYPYMPAVSGAAAQPPTQSICVQAGDRLFLIANVLTDGNVLPDGTTGAGAGYMPHWVYRPFWCRTQDVNQPPADRAASGTRDPVKLYDGLNGNASVGPTIRVDLGYLYCPWAGVVCIEGGRAAGASGTCIIQMAWGWDQQARQRQRWWELPMELIARITGTSRAVGPIKFPRLPVDGRLIAETTLTFYNAHNVDGTALAINRPQGADKVWTIDQQSLTLDNGAGTLSSTVRTNGEANGAPLGGFSRVTAVATNVTPIVFRIRM